MNNPSSPVKLQGGCACGDVRYECMAEPVLSLNCHCSACQRYTGTAYASVRIVPSAAFRFVRGELRYHTSTSNAGHTVSRGFCPNCGSQVHGRIAEKPEVVLIAAGTLDDASVYPPSIDVFTSRAQPWDVMNPGLAKFEEGIPAGGPSTQTAE
ncbi:GFA family protein [Cupriavidus nantongensis]|uniref:Aldehyde-activating protein n=1 Tax=Cupriavidus nantongensis TaxID=1796606 RepID=A0A142JVB9_9BURK|nr:GFA family protein [Cupriavidus nantongensis]AMR82031.1 aldehyde-activating protein [Cupriavidus nantongensis]